MDAVFAGSETEARTEGSDLLLQQEGAEVREAVGDAAEPEGRREQADGPSVPQGEGQVTEFPGGVRSSLPTPWSSLRIPNLAIAPRFEERKFLGPSIKTQGDSTHSGL